MEEEKNRRPTPDHPPYSEMVQCAIRDLAEDHGSTEPAISDYIRAHYDSLPWAHSRLLPYYLHKLLLAGEITRSPLPNRYILPSNPNPNTPRKRGRCKNPNTKPKSSPGWPKRGRGRPRKATLPEPTCSGPDSVSMSKSAPRLILKLKRSDAILVDPQGGVYAGSSWRCLREEAQVQGENLTGAESNGPNDEQSDGITVDVPEENINGITIDEHYDELFALRESDLNGIKTDRHGEEFMALRDEELNGITIDELSKDLESVKNKEHAEELSVMQEKDSNGIGIYGSNDGLLASRENDLNDTKTDRHGEEFMSLQDEELNRITIDELSKDLESVKNKEHAKELSVMQEKDSNGIRIYGSNDGLLALRENDLNGTKTDRHDKEFIALRDEELNHITIDELGKDLISVNRKEQAEELSAIQEKDSNGIKIDGSNELLTLQGCSFVDPGLRESDQVTSHKKAKPRKGRRLWYEC